MKKQEIDALKEFSELALKGEVDFDNLLLLSQESLNLFLQNKISSGSLKAICRWLALMKEVLLTRLKWDKSRVK